MSVNEPYAVGGIVPTSSPRVDLEGGERVIPFDLLADYPGLFAPVGAFADGRSAVERHLIGCHSLTHWSDRDTETGIFRCAVTGWFAWWSHR